jgi:hypothetical protein
MKCIDKKYTTRDIAWDQYNYSYEFEQFESIPTKTNFNFVHVLPDSKVFEDLDDFVVLQVELPNCLLTGKIEDVDIFKYNHKIKKIITNCPFSVEYFNDYFHYDKFIHGYIPFNPKYTPHHGEKIYDVYHTGHVHNSAIFNIFPLLEKFNHCFVCADYGSNKGIGYEEKLALNAKSKISIIHNLIKWPVAYIPITSNLSGHKAFSLVKEYGLVPQIKTRVFEAVQSKSLMLCLHDPWNMIEHYFRPNIDFIYWYNEEDLKDKISYILTHYDDYIPIIENAYNRLITTFTLKNFFETFLLPL